jgi:glycosyltransferase involved in cell wall biosynthesis
VITVSHQSKADIAASYNYPPERIHVIYNWVADELTQAPTGDESPALNGRPYILTVAAVKPHKNLLTALDAIATLGPAVPHDYVIAGHTDVEPRYTELLRRRAADLGIEQQLHLVGAVDDQTLASLYRGADLLLLPSLYEGFGYPLIEAMHFGVPIVTANTGSLPEVAQCAALAVSPTDARAMAEAVEAALTDGSLRARLVAAGRRRGEQFTKERAVAGVLDVYRLLEGAPSPV